MVEFDFKLKQHQFPFLQNQSELVLKSKLLLIVTHQNSFIDENKVSQMQHLKRKCITMNYFFLVNRGITILSLYLKLCFCINIMSFSSFIMNIVTKIDKKDLLFKTYAELIRL